MAPDLYTVARRAGLIAAQIGEDNPNAFERSIVKLHANALIDGIGRSPISKGVAAVRVQEIASAMLDVALLLDAVPDMPTQGAALKAIKGRWEQLLRGLSVDLELWVSILSHPISEGEPPKRPRKSRR